jgi:hypothetical protein
MVRRLRHYSKGTGMMRPFLGSLVACLAVAAGLLTPTADAASCGARATTKPFAAWNDQRSYFLAPNGGFESGSMSWRLGGGAKVVSGNEPFFVRGPTDRFSLSIPSGGWAETLPFCVDGDEPTLRFFARNTGSALSQLAVSVTVRTTVLGITAETTLPLGAVLGTTTTWQPSLPTLIGLSLNQLLGGTTTVSFRFMPLLAGGAWQLDDVYVDPFKDW